MKSRLILALTTTALTLGVTACNSTGGGNPLTAPSPTTAAGGAGTVVVGSANFPENVLLASIYSQALQAKGLKVQEKFNIGSREVLFGQVQSGNLTVLSEYNGALLAYLDPKATAATESDVNTALAKALPASLRILNSSAAQEKDSLTVSRSTADRYHLTSITDLAAVAGQFTVGGQPEFESRRKQQFKDVYGLRFKDWKPTSDTTANAISDGTIQVGNVFTTDPRIVQLDLVPLADPKNIFGAQNITPLVNKAEANPTVTNTLNTVSAKLDTAQLVTLMKRVSIDKDDPSTVARKWLKSVGLA
ncbi:ABC transporter substrate-binding protein [Streptomyces massasporeus]|uniref:ABC transporter substrate-binding protein n=1 Tax=Streptomyces massasporeus TaxID=67324 RepID=UPI0036AB9382